MHSAYFLIIVYKSNTDVHKGKVPTAKTKDYGMYLLGVFDGAKGQVSDHVLVRTLIPLRPEQDRRASRCAAEERSE
jgi:hypothetical protein